jgi:hypothetical protein
VHADFSYILVMTVGLYTWAWVTLLMMQPPLGTALRVEGFVLRPPEGFRMVRMEPYGVTRVGGVAGIPGVERVLGAALVDGQGDGASSMLLARVEGTFLVSPSARDEFATAAVRHFNEELGFTLMMERAERVEGPVRRIEVLGTVRQEGQLRQVLIAAMEGEGRHAVIVFSVPSGRFQEKAAALRASLDSFRPESAPSTALPRGLAGAVAGAMAGGLLASFALWRRLRAQNVLRKSSP